MIASAARWLIARGYSRGYICEATLQKGPDVAIYQSHETRS